MHGGARFASHDSRASIGGFHSLRVVRHPRHAALVQLAHCAMCRCHRHSELHELGLPTCGSFYSARSAAASYAVAVKLS